LEIVVFGQLGNQCEHYVWLKFGMKKDQKKHKIKKIISPYVVRKEKLQLPFLQKPPQLIQRLLNGEDNRNNHYLQNIHNYNNMFSSLQLVGKFFF